ncbi:MULTISPECIES: ribosome recycling factor [Amycolatopsis]|uniref:Ribosome-recycling factor n=3 Tax=Amycolatopsis TaxID=1813 RepID=A0A076MSG3_AMYME|nr:MULTISPECIES: ribosome recycling factor [Amycolatopsis]AIJ21735.1 ribosome recycling factor [Amycolatopsis methanolica 239]MCF6423183.1 ribosome recycling factor [Amycolatopsis tucumanensis]ROS39456.1 ribosome recycling factor [Amycolatopsis thermoflava]
MIDETLLDAEEKMEKAVSFAKEDLSSVRTGRANPGMFARIMVEAYGSTMPLNQVAGVNIPEARMVIVKPYDQGQLGAIEKAIRESDLGVNPSNDGQIIRITIPQLTEERRKEMVKMVKAKGEDAKVHIRGVRRKSKEELDRIAKDGEAGEDEVARAEKELQHLTDNYVAKVDELVKHKEAELLEV